MLLIALLVYVGLGCCAYFFADRIAFLSPPPTYRDDGEMIKLSVANGNTISALHLTNPNAAYTILYSHGNGEDLGVTRPLLEHLQRIGFSVFAYDYEGYGTSTGKPSESNAYSDIDAAYEYLTERLQIPPSRIIAYGRSLGGAVAIDLAARKPLAGLVIESSFVSGFRVLIRPTFFPFDRFKSASKLKRVSCPTLVIHGTSDEVIGFWHGEKLYELANEPKMKLWIENAGHNNLTTVAGKRYDQTMLEFQSMVDANQKR